MTFLPRNLPATSKFAFDSWGREPAGFQRTRSPNAGVARDGSVLRLQAYCLGARPEQPPASSRIDNEDRIRGVGTVPELDCTQIYIPHQMLHRSTES